MSRIKSRRPKICETCGAPYPPRAGNSKHCSAVCAIQAHSAIASGGCRLWRSRRNAVDGHAQIRWAGRSHIASRLLWEEVNGPIPAGLHVLHICDMPNCVAIEHLQLGTHADNAREAKERGLLSRGARHYKARLSPSQVLHIRDQLHAGQSINEIAIQYGVTQGAIDSIKRSHSWKWLKTMADAVPSSRGRKAAFAVLFAAPATHRPNDFATLRAILAANSAQDDCGCILWRGRLNYSGYGKLNLGVRKDLRAHRIAMEAHLERRLLSSEHVLHSCNVRACININHLRIGSHADNMRDLSDRLRKTKALRQ